MDKKSEEIINSSLAAIQYDDNAEAYAVLLELKKFLASSEMKNINPDLTNKLGEMKIKLEIVAFSNINDEECAEIVKNHYLDAYNIEVNMENKLVCKLFMVPFEVRDELRERLKRSILENTQKLGDMALGEWIKKFEKIYPENQRDNSSIVKFVMEDSQAIILGANDKKKLKEVLHAYCSLLLYNIPTTDPVLSEILNDEELLAEAQTIKSGPKPIYNIGPETKQGETREKTKMAEALKKYPELGEQLITSNYIRLKMFPEPVRPSIKNWLSDYTFNLGQGSHDSVARGNYLFHRENTVGLGAYDRERLSYILKAYDENMEVEINTATKQVIFPKTETTTRPQGPSQNVVRLEKKPEEKPRNVVDLRE